MRILFLTDKFIPERGGSQIIFAHAYAHLPEHQVTVVTRAWPGDGECDAGYRHQVVRVPYSRVPRLRSPLLWLRLARRVRRLAHAEGCDQIHCGQPVETAPYGTLIAQRLGLPSVIHTFAEDVTSHLRHPVYGPLMRRALQRAAVVTTISRFTFEHLLNLGVPEERIVLLYPGVKMEQWQPTGAEEQVREQWGLEGKRVLLTVSRLIPRKGQDTVLQALPAVLAQVPEAAYVIVGGGPEESRLRALADRLGVADHVRFVGSIPNTETLHYYHACDVFVMPNRQMPNGDIEGFGLVFLEANACGKPVIGGRSGGTVDAIAHGESGFLVDPHSPGEVAERLVELLQSPDAARRLGEAGRQRVQRQFTWKRTGDTLHRIIAAAEEWRQKDRVKHRSVPTLAP
jgi:phosphatidyl-myo-inositol dimannoside synthase